MVPDRSGRECPRHTGLERLGGVVASRAGGKVITSVRSGRKARAEVNLGYLARGKVAGRLRRMPVFIDEVRAAEKRSGAEANSAGRVEALVQLLRSRSYEEIRQRMYDSAPGSAWWSACKVELELRNGQQMAEASVAMSRVSEKMRASTQHFEQLADTLHQATNDIADLLRGTQEAGRRLEIAVYVTIGVTLVQLFNLIFEVFRKR
jgi:hypothetical protein